MVGYGAGGDGHRKRIGWAVWNGERYPAVAQGEVPATPEGLAGESPLHPMDPGF